MAAPRIAKVRIPTTILPLYQHSLIRTHSSFSHSDGGDTRFLIDELVPGLAALLDDIVVGGEDAIGEPVVTHELPDVLDRIEFRAFGRQWQDRDVVWHDERFRQVPAGLIHQQHGMSARCDHSCNFNQMQVHALGIAPGQDQPGALAVPGADGTEDIAGGGPLVLQCRGSCAASGPPNRAQRRVILFFCPKRASSANQTSMSPGSMALSCAICATRAGKFF